MTALDEKPKRRLTRDDILPLADYVAVRGESRRRLIEIKRDRRLDVGPYAAFLFENSTTMWHQVQEMLYIEKGDESQIEDELSVYNELIPNGRELVATVMFQIDNPGRRSAVLARLGGIEDRVFVDIEGQRIHGEADPTRENTSPDGKASSVQFIRFGLTDLQVAAFKAAGARIVVGFDHSNYGHMTVMPESVRQALAADFD